MIGVKPRRLADPQMIKNNAMKVFQMQTPQ